MGQESLRTPRVRLPSSAKRPMSEIVNVVVAVAVIYFVARWATSSNETPEQRTIRTTLGFKPKKATREMVDTVASMFPDMPRNNIHYDLLRTGSVENTINKVIERGFLEPPPPAYYRAFPSNQQNVQASGAGGARQDSQPRGTASSKPMSAPSLIKKYQLEKRVVSGKDSEESLSRSAGIADGKSRWEATADRRQESLKERKAQMIIAARKRLQEQQVVTPAPGTKAE